MIQDSHITTARFEQVGIQFITYDDKQYGRSHDSKTRRLVRKQAKIASQHTQKSQLHSASDSRSFSAKATSLKEHQGRFRLQKSLEIPHNSTIYNQMCPYISPLEPTIRNIDHDASILLGYCKINHCVLYWTSLMALPDYHVFQRGCVAIDFEGNWLAFVLSNVATSHALLTLVALKYEAETREESPPLSSRHAAAAVRHLRQEIDSCPAVPDDAVVCAVALMTVTEVRLSLYSISHMIMWISTLTNIVARV